jgi:hypothetical protein
MKKLSIAIILGFMVLPAAAMAQAWVEPYMNKDGTFVEGHWLTPEDSWQRDYKRPGNINPMTGQFNTYGPRVPGSSTAPEANSLYSSSRMHNPYAIPGSSSPNPFAIPGSSPVSGGGNPYAIPGSSPASTTGR